jgi:hypothetical protein
MVVAGVVQAAHLSFVDGQQLDALAAPSGGAHARRAWTCKSRGCERWRKRGIALGAQPVGFSAADLAERKRERVAGEDGLAAKACAQRRQRNAKDADCRAWYVAQDEGGARPIESREHYGDADYAA